MLIFFTIAALGLSIWLFIWWLGFNYHGKTKLRLKTFQQVYTVNPYRWRYEKQCWSDDFKHLLYFGGRGGNGERIRLSFPVFVWFMSFTHLKKYGVKKQKERDQLIFILENCQRDIDRIKSQSEEQITQALKEQKRILDSWMRRGIV